MKKKFTNICITSTSKNKEIGLIASQIYEILQNKGCKIYHDSSLKNHKQTLRSQYRSDSFITKNIDLIVAIGGDGTILNSSRKFGSKGLPIRHKPRKIRFFN